MDTLVLDKTGTLTEGKPAVIAIQTAVGQSATERLRLSASLENRSEHPLARAIVAAAKERGLALAEASDFDSPTGKGVMGVVEGHMIALGAEKYMAELKVQTASLARNAEELRREGATAIYLSVDGAAAAVFGIADRIKATTPGALAALKAQGIRLVMLTGDNAVTAEVVGRKLGIDTVEAEVLPEDKSRIVSR